jgi:hypothetical protein
VDDERISSETTIKADRWLIIVPPVEGRCVVAIAIKPIVADDAAVPRDTAAAGGRPIEPLMGDPDADLVEVALEVGGVLVDPIGAGALQLVLAVAAGE